VKGFKRDLEGSRVHRVQGSGFGSGFRVQGSVQGSVQAFEQTSETMNHGTEPLEPLEPSEPLELPAFTIRAVPQ
jgi:hypothetical protein